MALGHVSDGTTVNLRYVVVPERSLAEGHIHPNVADVSR